MDVATPSSPDGCNMLLSDVCSVAPAYLTMMSQCTDTPLSAFCTSQQEGGNKHF